MAPGDLVPCTIAAGSDVLVTSLRADLRAVRRLDLLLLSADGGVLMREMDLPFDPEGLLYITELADLARRLPSMDVRIRLVSVDEGDDRLLGEYVLEHRPSRLT